jgi:hypothetical protein
MNEPDYVSQPGDHHGPYSALSYDALKEAYERVTVDLSRPTAPTRLAKLEARGVAQ